jgi:predicted unusual protein kinase regulating ubiquinone biosynthesis (AarF/ABC1/UbiB family)
MTAVLRDELDDPAPGARVPFGRLGPAEAARLAEILGVLARHGVLTVVRTSGTFALHPRSQPPRALAVALRRSFVELGPTFIKLGQLMASSPGLFPELLATEMRQLLDAVPPESSPRVVRIIERQLGAPLGRLFADFDPVPIAAASIAQVHRARLFDGTDVAVKVRRPRLRGRVERDLKLLRLLAGGLGHAGALGRAANPTAVVDDLAVTMREELDLRREARDMVAFGANLSVRPGARPVIVPTPIDGMVGERVLVMTFIDGVPVDDGDALRVAGHDLEDILRTGMLAWMQSAFVHGLFHGDMHAGNVFITPRGEVAFLDFGIMGRLSPATRGVFLRLLPAVVMGERDYALVLQALADLGGVTRPLDLGRAVADLEELVVPLVERPIGEVVYGEVLDALLRVATTHHIRLPRELVALVKQLLYFERYAKDLAPDYEMYNDPVVLEVVLAGLAGAASD